MSSLCASRLLSVFFSIVVVLSAGCSQQRIGESILAAIEPGELRTVLASSNHVASNDKPTAPFDCADLTACTQKWDSIEKGWTDQQVVEVLGIPVSVVESEIFVDRVTQQWLYRGGLIKFDNGKVHSVVAASSS